MKQVHWQLPFASLNGTQYRIDIYSDADENENANWPIQLVGGATPFTTDEDNSDDFFAPVRGQTGVISIVNTSGELSIYDILPADNTDKPVRVVRVSDGVVVWQGFLNAEAYSQGYNDRPQQIDINVNSMLEAMDSVQIARGYTAQLMFVKQAIANILEQLAKLHEVETLYDNIYYPVHGWRVLQKIVNMSAFYDIKEIINEEKWDYEYTGVSTKDVLAYICKFMGWCVREDGRSLIFTAQGEDTNGYYRQTWEHFATKTNFTPDEQVSVLPMDITENVWMAADHTITVNAGARSVEVIAIVKPFDFNMESPDCPYGDLEEHYLIDHGPEHGGDERDIDIYFNKATGSYSNITHSYWMYRARPSYNRLIEQGSGTLNQMIAHLLMKGNNSSYIRYWMKGDEGQEGEQADQLLSEPFYVGSCLCKSYFRLNEEEKDEDKENPLFNFNDGLYCSFLPEMGANTDARILSKSIFRMDSTAPLVASSGFVRLDAKALFVSHRAGNIEFTRNSHYYGYVPIRFRLKWGNMFYTSDNTNPWSTQDQTFVIRFDLDDDSGNFKGNWEQSMRIAETGGWLIPVLPNMTGYMSLDIMPAIGYIPPYGASSGGVSEIVFDTLKVDYIPTDEVTLSNRGENKYYTITGMNFKEEISTQLDLASSLNNDSSISILLDSATQQMETINYGVGPINMYRRPEVDLLQRLKRFYAKAITTLELKVDTKPSKSTPLVRITGYDGKTYLPLSESRDWKMDTSTIRCWECPE